MCRTTLGIVIAHTRMLTILPTIGNMFVGVCAQKLCLHEAAWAYVFKNETFGWENFILSYLLHVWFPTKCYPIVGAISKIHIFGVVLN